MMADKIEVDLGKACEIIRPSLDNVWWEVSPSDAAKLQTFAGENQSLIVVPQGTGTFHILAIHGKSRDWYQVMVVGPENPQPLPAPSRVAEIARRAWKSLPSISAFKPLGILVMFLALSYGVNHYGPLVLDRLKPRPTPVNPVNPADPFTESIRAAYQSEKNPAVLKELIAICNEAATATDDVKLATAKSYLDFVGAKVKARVGAALPNTRRLLDDEIERSVTGGMMVTDTAPFTPDMRQKAKDAFNRSAVALTKAGE